MKEFQELIAVADALNDPNGGCPWDLEQTFESLRVYLLEESHEALEAIDSSNDREIIEELGDLLYIIIFYGKIAEREKRFSLSHVLDGVRKKMVRRHPHVFEKKRGASIDEIKQNWERIKKEEKKDRASALDGIPKNLPSLHKAFMLFHRMKKKGYTPTKFQPTSEEDKLSLEIYEVMQKAADEKLDVESAFRTFLTKEENLFKEWERLH